MEDHKNYDVVCYSENLNGFNHLKQVNHFCRSANIGFILTENLGLLGYAFVDYGENHKIFDHDGEPTKSFMIANFTNEEKATITVHWYNRHSY